MDDDVEYAGPLLAGRYRLPRTAGDLPEPDGTRAYDTASGQEVLAHRVLLPEVVEAEFLEDGSPAGPPSGQEAGVGAGRATRRPADPAVRRAVDAALAASRIPDHPRLDQVYDVFVEGDALWIVSELLPAQPLAELIAGRPLAAHRAAEIAADVLAALRTVHAHGWVHRNVTARTVVVCEDGRAMLTGLAAGAAEEALCGLAPQPDPSRAAAEPRGGIPPVAEPVRQPSGGTPPPGLAGAPAALPSAAHGPLPAGFQRGDGLPGNGREDGPESLAAHGDQGRSGPHGAGTWHAGTPAGGAAARAARRGAIAAYRAGTQAASVRVAAEAQGRNEEWWAGSRPPAADGAAAPQPYGPQGRPYGAPAPESHGPTALPGPRPEPGRPVPTPWSKDVAPSDAAPDAAPDAEPAVVAGGEDRYRGPATSLAAERARQARMTVVGAVTERWAPEQAGPVHENWRLAPPVGPSADLWALGVLLFRAVQGHAPYPEDDVAELVQLVCAEPPAFAEECGPLRPVVESLLRQDPTERPDFEVLRGWLRSLIRSAPEPDVGRHTLTGPPSLEPGRPADPRRLPILRRRGELVRRRRAGRKSAPGRAHRRTAAAPKPRRAPRAARPAHSAPAHAHHEPAPPRAPRRAPRPSRAPRPPRTPRPGGGGSTGSPRSLGRLLLGGVLLLLTAAVLYAMWFMPERNQADDGNRRSSVGAPEAPAEPTSVLGGEQGTPDEPTADDEPPAETQPQTSEPAAPAEGFRVHEDPTGFRIAVPEGWDRTGPNGRGQVRFDKGEFEMVVVKGRDAVKKFGADPMVYQSESEPELKPFRTSDWSSASGLRRIDVGDTAMAEGTYTWQDSSGRDVYVRNRAMILGGRYHLVLVIGPEDEREAVDRWFEGAADTYRVLR